MLKLNDASSSDIHEFSLTSEEINKRIKYTLSSPTYAGLELNFTLETDRLNIYPGYSVTVHMFKNPFFSQSDIVELRVANLSQNSGRIGFFFRLDALFEDQTVELSNHNYTYAHYAIEKLFSESVDFQTKSVTASSNQAKITDFFDEDTIILVICNEYANNINNYSINNYLPHLFLDGFTYFTNENPISDANMSSLIENKYLSTKSILSPHRNIILKIPKANNLLKDELFITLLFRNLIQKENELVTRFIILYQIVEILINRVLFFEVQKKVCADLQNLTGQKLKDVLNEQSTEKKRITLLLNTYARPYNGLHDDLKNALIDFYVHISDVDYGDITRVAEFSLTDVFYGYRNKLVHNYRIVHTSADITITEAKMDSVNNITEVLIANLIVYFNS